MYIADCDSGDLFVLTRRVLPTTALHLDTRINSSSQGMFVLVKSLAWVPLLPLCKILTYSSPGKHEAATTLIEIVVPGSIHEPQKTTKEPILI